MSGRAAESWTPAFPGQRPPFEPGNQAALKTGEHVNDPRLSADPQVAAWAEWIRNTQLIYHPSHEGTIWRLGLTYRRLEINEAAQIQLAARLESGSHEELAQFVGDSKVAERLRYDHDRWHARAGKLEAALGREPLAATKLGLALKDLSSPLDMRRLDAGEEDDLRRLLAKAAGLLAGGDVNA